MGLVSKLLSFVRTQRFNTPISDVKVDIGGRPLKTLEHFSTPDRDWETETKVTWIGKGRK